MRFVSLPGRESADPFQDDDVEVSVRVVRILPGVERSPHRHPHSCEVVYVLDGSGTVWQDGRTATVGRGDVVYVPRGVAHATLATTAPLLLSCFFPHPDLAANLEELPDVLIRPESGIRDDRDGAKGGSDGPTKPHSDA